jgi:hypothetical protein
LSPSLLPFAFLLLSSLKVAFAGVVSAVAVYLDVVLGTLAVDAAKLLALLDGAGAGRVLAGVGGTLVGVCHGLVGHLRGSSGFRLFLEKMLRFYAKSRGESRREAFSL